MSLTPTIWNALRRRYKPPEWALFSEVRNGAGHAAIGSADAIGMNLWPSRGLVLFGFEIKQDRRDWQRELAKPAKAERFARFCDEWWVVTTPDVIKDEAELPPGWGWLLLPKRGNIVAKNLKVMRKATPKAEQPVLPRGFMAALLRRANEMTENAELIKAAHHEGFDAGLAEGRSKSEAAGEIRILEQKVRAMNMELEQIAKARKAAGLDDFSLWEMERVGKYVRMLLRLGPNNLVRSYERLADQASTLAGAIDESLAEARSVQKGTNQ